LLGPKLAIKARENANKHRSLRKHLSSAKVWPEGPPPPSEPPPRSTTKRGEGRGDASRVKQPDLSPYEQIEEESTMRPMSPRSRARAREEILAVDKAIARENFKRRAAARNKAIAEIRAQYQNRTKDVKRSY
jgi:hypothetical protein